MKQLLLMTACLLLLCENKCYARIGETLEECEKRYGKRITDKSDIMQSAIWMLGYVDEKNIGKSGEIKMLDGTYCFFRLDKYVIYIELFNGKVDSIGVVNHPLWNRNSSPIEMSKKEIDAIIDANTKEVECDYFTSDLKVLIIWTKEHKIRLDKKRVDDKKEQDEKARNVLKKF